MRAICLLSLLLAPLLATAQNTLEIQVEGVDSSEGLIRVAVYNSEASFLDEGEVYFTDSVKAVKGTTKVSISDLPAGEYALAIFHDRNANERLDTNWIGVPKEPYGFSNARTRTFGPPRYRDCVLKLQKDMIIQVPLE